VKVGVQTFSGEMEKGGSNWVSQEDLKRELEVKEQSRGV